MRGKLTKDFREKLLDGLIQRVQTAASIHVKVASIQNGLVKMEFIYKDEDGVELFHYDDLPAIPVGASLDFYHPSDPIDIHLLAG